MQLRRIIPMTLALALAFACGHAFVPVPAVAGASGAISSICGWGLVPSTNGWVAGSGPPSYHCSIPLGYAPAMCSGGYVQTNFVPSAPNAPSTYTCMKSTPAPSPT